MAKPERVKPAVEPLKRCPTGVALGDETGRDGVENRSRAELLAENDSLRMRLEELQAQREELQARNLELVPLWEKSCSAEEALRAHQDLLEMVVNHVPAGLVVIRGGDLRIQWVNPAYQAIAPGKVMVGKTLDDLWPETGRTFLDLCRQVLATGEPYHAVDELNSISRSPGAPPEAAYFTWSLFRVRLPGEEGWALLCTAWETTKRKKAEAAILKVNQELEVRVAQRTEELAAMVDQLRDEIAERIKAEESIRRLNQLYAVLTETNQAIVRAKDRETLFRDFCSIVVGEGSFLLAWVGLLDEESGRIYAVAADGATGYLHDLVITCNDEPAGLGPTGLAIRDGSFFICNDFQDSPITRPWQEKAGVHGIRASASIALKQEGRVIGALTLYADKKDFFDRQQVDLLRQMGADVSFALDNMVREARSREAERALIEESAERLRASEALREQEQMLIQQSRLAAIGEMIGHIAHQWRQPLNLLGLIVQRLLLFSGQGQCDGALLAESTEREMELIRHMSKTIDDFTNYFKPDKQKTDFKVQESIGSTLSLLKGSLHCTQISVEVVADDDPVIHGYPNEFAQALLNIVANAKDVLMERETADPKVTITARREAGRAVVTIADNGGGIPEEVIGKIFDPYFSTKGPQHGTGVGLYISKNIIERNMGGRLLVRNIPCGAEFRIEV